MKQLITILLFVLLLTICYANDNEVNHFMNLSANIPKSMMISVLPSWELYYPQLSSNSNDPNQLIRKREIDYTMIWLNKTINPDILRKFNKEDFKFLSDLGKNKDDALMISWSNNSFDIRIVDGRILVLSICVKNEVQADVEEVFKKVVNYWYHVLDYMVKVNFETTYISDSGEAWGRIKVDQGFAAGWYEKPVEWYQAGNEIIFTFEKFAKMPVSRIPYKVENAPLYFGGIPIDDDRSYLRFDKSNRQEFTKEYLQKSKNENKVPKVNNNRLNGLASSRKPSPAEPNQ